MHTRLVSPFAPMQDTGSSHSQALSCPGCFRPAAGRPRLLTNSHCTSRCMRYKASDPVAPATAQAKQQGLVVLGDQVVVSQCPEGEDSGFVKVSPVSFN